MALKRFVVEITMVVDDEGTEETFLFSTSAFATKPTDVPPNTPVYGYLDNPGTFKQELFSGARVTGAVTPSFGGITLSNHAPVEGAAGVLDHWVDYGVSGGRVIVRWGEEGGAYPSQYTTVYIGYARTPRIGVDKVLVPLTDGSWLLDAPVVTEGFDGSGGLEGFGAVAKPKQFVSGDPGFLIPILVDSIRQIYFVQSTGTDAHDLWQLQPTAEVNPFDVFELGQKIDRVASNYSSASDVVDVEPDPGTVRYWFGPDSTYVTGWKTGPVYFRLGTPPIGELRVYPQGRPIDADHARAGGGVGSFSFATMALRAGVTLDRIADGYTSVGAVLVDDDTTYLSLLSKASRATQAWFGFTRLDMFRSGYLLDPNDDGYNYGVSSEVLPVNPLQPTTSVYTFTPAREDSLRREPVSGMEAPVWSLFVKARKTWPCPVSEEAPDALKDYLTRDPWWATFQGVSDTTKVANPGAIVETLEIETADFPNAFSRRLFLERYFALFGGRRDFFILKTKMTEEVLALELHDVVTLQTPRFGLSAGRKFRIISIDIDCRGDVPSITFGLWGGSLGQFTGTVSLVSNIGSPQVPQIQSGRRVFGAFRREGVGTASGSVTPSGSLRTFASFTRLTSGTAVTLVWTEDERLQASNAASSNAFGHAVALSSDGSYLAVNAYGEDTTASNSGALYIFLRSGSSWSQQQMLKASDAAVDDALGNSTFSSFSYPQNTIGMSDAGDRVAIGCVSKGSTDGAVYIFSRSGTTWTQEQKLSGAGGAGDNFGLCVAMSANGDYLAIGAPRRSATGGTDAGVVYIFTRSGTTWSEQAQLSVTTGASAIDSLGMSVAINGDGSTVIAGRPQVAKADVFTRSGASWSHQQALQAGDNASSGSFGQAVAISTDGNTAVVGSVGHTTTVGTSRGAAYVFTRSGSTWTQAVKLFDPAGASGDAYGSSVAIGGDGGNILVGSPARDGSSLIGGVFVYRGVGSWGADTMLLGSDSVTPDQVGNAVTMSRDGVYAAIGVQVDTNSGGTNAGSVYTFTLS